MHNYINQFSSLHVNKQRGQIAPHKAMLLLSVMDLVANGSINSNKIEFSEKLEEHSYRIGSSMSGKILFFILSQALHFGICKVNHFGNLFLVAEE